MELYAVTRRRLGTEKMLWFRSEFDFWFDASSTSVTSQRERLSRSTFARFETKPRTDERSFPSFVVFDPSEFPDCKIVNQQVYNHCIFPRVLLSLEDAAFCAKFIKMMHSMGTQNFASLWYHDGVSLDVPSPSKSRRDESFVVDLRGQELTFSFFLAFSVHLHRMDGSSPLRHDRERSSKLRFVPSSSLPRISPFFLVSFETRQLTSLLSPSSPSPLSFPSARFVHDCLQDLMPWQEDEEKYTKEAWGVKAGEKAGDKESVLPGFRAKLLRQTVSPPAKEELLPWNGYRKVMHKWHKRFASVSTFSFRTRLERNRGKGGGLGVADDPKSFFVPVQAFETCVDSKEYMHIKNVVIVLQKILPFFPREAGLGEQMERKLKSAIADETREDLKLLLQSYVSSLFSLPNREYDADFFPFSFVRAATRLKCRSSSPSGYPCLNSELPKPSSLCVSCSPFPRRSGYHRSDSFRLHSRRELLARTSPPPSSTRPSLSPPRALPPPLLLLSLEQTLPSGRRPPPPLSSRLLRLQLRLRSLMSRRNPRSTRTSSPNPSRPLLQLPSPRRRRLPNPPRSSPSRLLPKSRNRNRSLPKSLSRRVPRLSFSRRTDRRLEPEPSRTSQVRYRQVLRTEELLPTGSRMSRRILVSILPRGELPFAQPSLFLRSLRADLSSLRGLTGLFLFRLDRLG